MKCDGKCSGEAKSLSCKGGEMKAQCKADANCEANCKASASAKAECSPPRLDIAFAGAAKGGASADAALMIEAIRIHLPHILLVFKARGETMVESLEEGGRVGLGDAQPGQARREGHRLPRGDHPVVTQASANVQASVEASSSIPRRSSSSYLGAVALIVGSRAPSGVDPTIRRGRAPPGRRADAPSGAPAGGRPAGRRADAPPGVRADAPPGPGGPLRDVCLEHGLKRRIYVCNSL